MREAWDHLTQRTGMARDVAKQLEEGYDDELPVLSVDRAIWSCQNGVFDGVRGEFFDYESEEFMTRDFVATKYVDLWYEHEEITEQMRGPATSDPTRPPSARFRNVEERRFCIACGRQDRFHPTSCDASAGWTLMCEICGATEDECECSVCPTCGGTESCADDCVDAEWWQDALTCFYPYERRDANFMDISTPWFDSILKYQQLGNSYEEEREVWKWVYIYLGRLFFEVRKENDDWQVAFFIKGQANTGKSTIADWLQKWLLERNVGILSNDAQEQFGLADLLNADGSQKQLVICLEAKADFSMPQAALQSIITGESVMASWKHDRSKHIPKWRAPLFMLGNELPGVDTSGSKGGQYKDNAGSLSRRFVILDFAKELTDELRDNHLGNRLFYREGLALLTKCLAAYNWARHEYKAESTWGRDTRRGNRRIMPEYFHRTREMMRAQSNSLVAFLKNPSTAEQELMFHPEAYIPENDFTLMWKARCGELGFRTNQQWNADFYGSPFGRYHLTVTSSQESRAYPPNGDILKRHVYINGIGRRDYFEGLVEESERASASASRGRNSAASWWTYMREVLAKTGSDAADDRSVAEFARTQLARGGSLRAVLAELSDEEWQAEVERRHGGGE